LSKLERDYQPGLIKRIESRFPGCLVLKNDEQYIAGIPDLTILYGFNCALLEVKKSADDHEKSVRNQPNQYFYLTQVTEMGGFACYIYPEVEDEVLDALQHAFESRR
jgi:hypothetical protein